MSRILVVDDEQSMREMLAIMLRKEGYEVVAAEGRAQAAAVLGREPVDMVITDLAVIEVVEKGLLLKEIAPGWTVEEVQEVTEPRLIIADDFREIEL